MKHLREERNLLEGDWKSLPKSRPSLNPVAEQEMLDLQKRLKQALSRPAPEPKKPIDLRPNPAPPIKPDPPIPPPEPKKAGPGDPKTAPAAPVPLGPAVLNPLHLGHVLFRAERYEEALTAFRLVELKTQPAEDRAAIQYLMARCLLHLSKNAEAADLLREAANSRVNERIAEHAQWQLEMVRWRNEVEARLQNIRQRRAAAEKGQ